MKNITRNLENILLISVSQAEKKEEELLALLQKSRGESHFLSLVRISASVSMVQTVCHAHRDKTSA